MIITFTEDQAGLASKFYTKYGYASEYARIDANDLEILLRRRVHIDNLRGFVEVNDTILDNDVPESWPDSRIQVDEETTRQVTFQEYTWVRESDEEGKSLLFIGHLNPPGGTTRPDETPNEELYRWVDAYEGDAIAEPQSGWYLFQKYSLTEYKMKVFAECQADYEAFLAKHYSGQRQQDFHLQAIAKLAAGQTIPSDVASVLNWIRQGPLDHLEDKKTELIACETKAACDIISWNFNQFEDNLPVIRAIKPESKSRTLKRKKR